MSKVYVVRLEIDEENGQEFGNLEEIIYEKGLANDIDILEIYED